MPVKPKRFSEKRLARIKDLIETVPSELVKGKLRYDILSKIASRHGVSYDTVKRDLYIISYAFVPDPISRREASLVDVWKDYKADVRELRRLASAGEIDKNKARQAGEIFLAHAPNVDKERILEVHGIRDKDIEKLVEKYTFGVGRIYRNKIALWHAHPAKAYAFAWNIAGNKIHRELERARKLTEKLNRIAVKVRQKSRLTASEKKFLNELGIDKTDVTKYIDPNKSFTENLKDMYKRVLEHNQDYIHAKFHYESAGGYYVRVYRHFKDKINQLGRAVTPGRRPKPSEMRPGDVLENTYRAIMRWPYKPGVKPRNIPDYARYFAHDISVGLLPKEVRSLPKRDLDELIWHMKQVRDHLEKADRRYTQLKEREREDPIIRWITGGGGK